MMFLKKLFTGSDNETPSLIRITFAIVLLQYLACVTWDCYITHDFPMVAFGDGVARILASFGAALWLSKDFQPGINDQKKEL